MGFRVLRVLVVCVVGAALSVWSGVAAAKLVHPFVSSFGSFSTVQGVATDAAGYVYVYDGSAGEVLKFDSTGKPVSFAFTGTNAIPAVGSVGSIEGEIAVDSSSGPAKGDIYVAHGGSSIGIYDEAGEKIGELTEETGDPWGEACGVSVDSSGNVYVGLYSSHVNKYVPAANPVTNAQYASTLAGLSGVCNVAADSAGDVFTDKWSSGPVTRYEPSQFGSLSATGSVVDTQGSTLAVDPANQELYVDEKNQITQFGPNGEPFEKPEAAFANEGAGSISGSAGVATSTANHDIYASDGNGHISVFGPGVELAEVTTGTPTELTKSSARLNGIVNPGGIAVTACQFEYGVEVGVFPNTTACSPLPGGASESVQVSATLTGLTLGNYHYRLAATNANGTGYGQEQTMGIFDTTPAGPPGLPDGRVYELVSPANKYGNQVLTTAPAIASGDGQAVEYGATGAIAENSSNAAWDPQFVSERTAYGWVTRSAMPLPVVGENSQEEYLAIGTTPTLIVPSSDLSHLLFGTWSNVQYDRAPDEPTIYNNIYLGGSDPFVEPVWVGRSLIEGAPSGVEEAGLGSGFFFAGASSDLKTIYFFYERSLFAGASHLYEYRDGILSDAGVLPGGETGTGLPLPAAQQKPTCSGCFGNQVSPAGFDNQVSADGSRIFFTRKDEAGTLELYVHVTSSDGSQSTILVSQSQLAGQAGEPAPSGPHAAPSTESVTEDVTNSEHGGLEPSPSYVFASPDGSHAFFQSTDRLTESAPTDSTVKTYDFDVDAGSLTYLPGVSGSIVTASRDGSSFVFEDTATSPFTLDRWAAGTGGGSVTTVAQLPSVSRNVCGEALCVGPAYTSTDGSVVVFSTESPIAGFNDGGSHYERSPLIEGEKLELGRGLWPDKEIFRYDATGEELSCVSCPPAGVTPSSNATVSRLADLYNARQETGWPEVATAGRSVSPDGGRVFFETREGLAPQDVNGTIDVYEWENGTFYLLSSGHSSRPSYLADASESGNDAFIATTERFAPGDLDGSYDVYDARVPRPGDVPPPTALPCSGDVCQGPPSVPQLLGQPASEAFSGAGNLTPSSGHAVSKSLTRPQKLARALKACQRRKNAGKRRKCERQARKKYTARASGAPRVGKQAAHQNGRGK